jgi:hypothetical protein
MTASWSLKGTVLIACNCEYGCPCNFNAPPSHGKCEGGWTWHVAEGAYGDVSLAGLNFSVFVKWPGAIHEGNGEAVIFIDERADPLQREALATLIKGEVGGPWGVLAWTWPTVHETKFVSYILKEDGINTRVTADHRFELEFTTIKNPVNGSEAHPAVLLPEGLIVKRADLGSSKTFRLHDEISMDHSGKYTAIGPFDYSGATAQQRARA